MPKLHLPRAGLAEEVWKPCGERHAMKDQYDAETPSVFEVELELRHEVSLAMAYPSRHDDKRMVWYVQQEVCVEAVGCLS